LRASWNALRHAAQALRALKPRAARTGSAPLQRRVPRCNSGSHARRASGMPR